MMNIRDIIRSADGGGDETEIAGVVLRKVLADHTADEQLAILLPLVRSEVVRMRRHRTRRKEDAAFTAADPMTALRILRNEPFTDVITKRQLTWAQATRRQHLARARWLRTAQIRPTMQTAARHEAAAALIAERHVRCLAELPEFGEAA
jgi:hypothetical protein